MKKIIITVILLGMICLLPMNTEAMVKVTEKGNEIAPSPAPDEVTTLMAPDEGGNGNSANEINYDLPTDLDKPVSSDDGRPAVDGNINDDVRVNDDRQGDNKDIMYTTDIKEDAALNSATKDSNSLLVGLIAGISGLSIGSIATFLILKKR